MASSHYCFYSSAQQQDPDRYKISMVLWGKCVTYASRYTAVNTNKRSRYHGSYDFFAKDAFCAVIEKRRTSSFYGGDAFSKLGLVVVPEGVSELEDSDMT